MYQHTFSHHGSISFSWHFRDPRPHPQQMNVSMIVNVRVCVFVYVCVHVYVRVRCIRMIVRSDGWQLVVPLMMMMMMMERWWCKLVVVLEILRNIVPSMTTKKTMQTKNYTLIKKL